MIYMMPFRRCSKTGHGCHYAASDGTAYCLNCGHTLTEAEMAEIRNRAELIARTEVDRAMKAARSI